MTRRRTSVGARPESRRTSWPTARITRTRRTTTMILYANMPFDATNPLCQDGNYPNGLISDGEINGGLAHEHNESVTDPLPNDAWTNGAGPDQGEEVGDECERRDGHPARHRPERLAVQPGDQRPPLLVPGDVEQLHPQLRAAGDAPEAPADREGDGHRGQRDQHDVRRQPIVRAGRRGRVQLADERRSQRPDRPRQRRRRSRTRSRPPAHSPPG